MSETAKCPGCGAGMKQVVEPDLKYERCSACDGIFLDAGELNALVTGSPGDIELCSIGEVTADRFPTRPCPKCPEHKMVKQSLVQHTEIVFDYCQGCHGWYLDSRELEETNAILNELRSGGAEYRGKHRGRLVTLVKIPVFAAGAVGPLGVSYSTTVEWDRVDVFYEHPLDVGLRVSPETWAGRLWRILGVPDVTTGDAGFDRHFHIKAMDGERTTAALSEKAREAILRFTQGPMGKLGKKNSFEVLDDRIVFCFTDQGDLDHRPTEDQEQALFDALAEIAVAIDGVP